jgi:hypothetical protein
MQLQGDTRRACRVENCIRSSKSSHIWRVHTIVVFADRRAGRVC